MIYMLGVQRSNELNCNAVCCIIRVSIVAEHVRFFDIFLFLRRVFLSSNCEYKAEKDFPATKEGEGFDPVNHI